MFKSNFWYHTMLVVGGVGVNVLRRGSEPWKDAWRLSGSTTILPPREPPESDWTEVPKALGDELTEVNELFACMAHSCSRATDRYLVNLRRIMAALVWSHFQHTEVLRSENHRFREHAEEQRQKAERLGLIRASNCCTTAPQPPAKDETN